MRTTTCHVAIATALMSLALAGPLGGQVALPPDDAAPRHPAAAERFNLGLRGVYFVENHGQWSDATVCFGLKSRGLDVAFRESSFAMHLSREVSGDVPVAVDRGAWASRPYESELVERASRPFDPPIAPEASPKRERGFSSFKHPDPLPDGRGSSVEPVEHEHLTLTITFPGSNPVTPRGAQAQTANFNYFVGGEGRGTASNVPSFGAVIYENLYDGVDLLVCGNDDGVMKYEFHCAPGADYTQIRIHYDGIDSLCVNNEGDLEIATSFGTLRDGAPIVWQEDSDSTSRAREEAGFAPSPGSAGEGRGGGESTSRAREEAVLDVEREAPLPDGRGSSDPTIPARFELIDAATYRIALDGEVDPMRELIIDPEIEWMYYLGGSNWDRGTGIAVDGAGNALVTGSTNSTDFAGRNNSHHGGDYDAFALKVSPSGQLQWMTYLGGSGLDLSHSIAVDGAGNALVTGHTISTDFAGRNNSYYGSTDADAFALKVSPSGQLQWMTYLGGSDWDEAADITVDHAGNALVSGETESTDFAGRNNSHYGSRYDAFALKVSPSGQLQWMTYLGGSGFEEGRGIAIDSSGNALVTGITLSTDFAGRNNSYYGDLDAFVLKVSPSGQAQWMTYLGGSSSDFGRGIAVDAAGNALAYGTTVSTDFEGRTNSYYGNGDALALKVSPSGQLQWMTYLGGSGSEGDLLAGGIAVDSAGNALACGTTTSTDFEGRTNSYYGNGDAFALKVSPSGQIQWMTYLGGSQWEHGYGMAVDPAGNALVTGETLSTDFSGRNNSYYGGTRDAFLVKLRLDSGPRLSVDATCPGGGPIRIEWSGASPGGQVALIFARNTGSFIVPSNYPCAGTQLGLGANQIQLAWQGGAGANGSRTLNTTAGPGACGGYLQLLDLTTCATSNVARIE